MQSLEITEFSGAISDFDDTIIDNRSGVPGEGLHERSRLDALRIIGKTHRLPELTDVPLEVNSIAFNHAPAHTAEGALWWILKHQGIIPENAAYNPKHPLVTELVTEKDRSYEALFANTEEVPGAHRFFSTLHSRGFAGKLAVASAGRRVDIMSFFARNNFDSLFLPEHIITKEDVQNAKPHPEPFQRAANAIQQEPKHTLAFEDDPNGIQSANAAGMFTCAITTRFSKEYFRELPIEKRPDAIAADFNEYYEMFGL